MRYNSISSLDIFHWKFLVFVFFVLEIASETEENTAQSESSFLIAICMQIASIWSHYRNN